MRSIEAYPFLPDSSLGISHHGNSGMQKLCETWGDDGTFCVGSGLINYIVESY